MARKQFKGLIPSVTALLLLIALVFSLGTVGGEAWMIIAFTGVALGFMVFKVVRGQQRGKPARFGGIEVLLAIGLFAVTFISFGMLTALSATGSIQGIPGEAILLTIPAAAVVVIVLMMRRQR